MATLSPLKLIVCAGLPGTGKSTLAHNSAALAYVKGIG